GAMGAFGPRRPDCVLGGAACRRPKCQGPQHAVPPAAPPCVPIAVLSWVHLIDLRQLYCQSQTAFFGQICWAIAFPAIQPVVHAAWKLNPPVMPSMSSSSPAKWSPGQIRLSMVLKFTSLKRTPPHVTQSSLFGLLPVTWH